MIKKVKVGPYTYRINYIPEILGTEETENGTMIQTGGIDYTHGEIGIFQSKNQDFQNTTLLHELIHAILYNSGTAPETQGSVEYERIIEAISIGFYQILKDNKSLRDLIAANFKLTR